METVHITFRAQPSLLKAAQQVLSKQDRTLSQFLRTALRDLVAANQQIELDIGETRRRPLGRPRMSRKVAL